MTDPKDFQLSSYEYVLPPELIAQHPPKVRGSSRLMVLRRDAPGPEHHMFSELATLLPPHSLLVANNSRVFPARLLLRRPGGGKAEVLLLTPLAFIRPEADALLRPAAKIPAGTMLRGNNLLVSVLSKGDFGRCRVKLQWQGDLEQLLARDGIMPLPPYIRDTPAPGELEKYQTTYASAPGSVAAPTAGLHFTAAMRERLAQAGHEWTEITLHVGYGTFSPVRCEDIRQHQMHDEYVEIPESAAEAVIRARAEGRPVVAIGTTATRTLEGVALQCGELRPFAGSINTFLYPGCEFRIIDGLLTNFHLPRSTLLMLVCALGGRQKVLNAYEAAVARGYRFFSWGDAMLVDRA